MWGQMGCARPREDHPKEKPQNFSFRWGSSDPALHEIILTIFIKNPKQNTGGFLSSLMLLK